MTDLKDLLDAVADRAAPIEDLADRAVNGAIRRRRRAMIAAPLVAAALAATAVLVPTQLERRSMEPERPTPTSTVRPVPGIPQVEIRTKDQPPLPERITRPAVLAYAAACSAGDRCTNPWRLLTVDGKQWNIADAAGDGLDTGAVSVAPNGERIAYLAKHPRNGSGYLVVRGLASGDVERPMEFPAAVIDQYKTSLSWSPDGRWLGIDFRPVRQVAAGNARKATLVDTTTMKTYPLPEPCCLAGLPSRATGWFPLVRQAVGQPGAQRTLRLSWSGDVTGEVPATAGGISASGPDQSMISPDGSVFATLGHPNVEAELAVVDAESGTVSTRRRLTGLGGSPDPAFLLLGWTGSHTVLMLAGPGGSAEGIYAIDVRDGTARLTYQLTGQPDRLSVATDGPAGGSR
jgi:hypothetical protein